MLKTLSIARTAVRKCLAWKTELVGIIKSNKNSNKILTRGDLMISLTFSIDINPQVFYIFVGLFVIMKLLKLFGC